MWNNINMLKPVLQMLAYAAVSLWALIEFGTVSVRLRFPLCQYKILSPFPQTQAATYLCQKY